jgi:hypothetical protein
LPTTDELLRHFERQVEFPWRDDLAPEYWVWILRYDQALERRNRNRVPEFEAITRRHGKGWFTVDLAGQPYREGCSSSFPAVTKRTAIDFSTLATVGAIAPRRFRHNLTVKLGASMQCSTATFSRAIPEQSPVGWPTNG